MSIFARNPRAAVTKGDIWKQLGGAYSQYEVKLCLKTIS